MPTNGLVYAVAVFPFPSALLQSTSLQPPHPSPSDAPNSRVWNLQAEPIHSCRHFVQCLLWGQYGGSCPVAPFRSALWAALQSAHSSHLSLTGLPRPPPMLRDPAQEPWLQLHTDKNRERIRIHGILPTHKTELYALSALWYNVLTKNEVLVVRRTTNTTR